MLGFTFYLPGLFPAFDRIPLTRTVESGYITVTVWPSFYKHIVVEWGVPTHWGNCTFDVYRSEQELGNYVKMTPSPVSDNWWKDTEVRDFSKLAHGWYLVEVHLPDGRSIQSQSITWEQQLSGHTAIMAREIDRRNALLLEKFTGVTSYIFRRRPFGKRCTKCWDHNTEKVTDDRCPVCYGTSFEGGYFSPYETLIQYDLPKVEVTLEDRGRVENILQTCWTVSKPDIEEYDLILKASDWKMFRIESVDYTALQTRPLRQILTLSELSKDSIEYKLGDQLKPEAYR